MGANGVIRAFRDESARDLASEFEGLYRENYPTVYNSVYYNMLDRDAAEDVTAEAFMRAARYFERFDSSRAGFATWVKAIARNCMADHYGKNKPTSALEDVPEAVFASDEGHASRAADADLVRFLLAAIEEDDRTLVFMKYYEGKRNAEIAQELEMNPSTVATRLQRALAKMRSVANGSV